MSNRYNSKKQYEALAKKTGVNKIVSRMEKLDTDGFKILSRSLKEEITPVMKERMLSEIRGLVQSASQDVKGQIETTITQGYVEGVNRASEWGIKSNPKETILYKWSGGEKGDINEMINQSFGNATMGDGTYFAMDAVSSQEFGNKLTSFAIDNKTKLYDMTKGANPKSMLDVQTLQAQDPMYRKFLMAKTDLGFTDWIKTKGYNGVIFFSDTGDAKWVSLNNSFAKKGVKQVVPPDKKVTEGTIKTDPNMTGHLYAVNALLDDTYLDFGKGFNDYARGAEKILNEATRRQMRNKILEGRLKGSSVQKISKEIQGNLQNKNFQFSLIDRGGKKWSIADYSNMLTRTHLIKANNEGTINRANEYNIDIVQISNHATACPTCMKYENKIYSLSGSSKKYPQLDLQPPFHPNCRHAILLRPDLD